MKSVLGHLDCASPVSFLDRLDRLVLERALHYLVLLRGLQCCLVLHCYLLPDPSLMDPHC